MKKAILASSIALLTSFISYAQIAEVELSKTVIDTDEEGRWNDTETDTIEISGKVYFSQLDTSKGPLAEVSFLDKKSYISLSREKADITYKREVYDSYYSPDYEETLLNMSFKAVTNSDLIFAGHYQKLDSSDDFNSKRYQLGMGFYMNDNASIVFSLIKEDFGYNSSSKGFDTALKYFIPFNNGEALSVGGNVNLVSYDFNRNNDPFKFSINAFIKYYLTNNLNLALSTYSDVISLDDNSDTMITHQKISFGSEYFINKFFAINGHIGLGSGEEEERYDDTETTETFIKLGLKTRF